MARARAAPDLAERMRWLKEAMRLHLLGLDRLREEFAAPEPRSFDPRPQSAPHPRRDN